MGISSFFGGGDHGGGIMVFGGWGREENQIICVNDPISSCWLYESVKFASCIGPSHVGGVCDRRDWVFVFYILKVVGVHTF